MEWTRPKHIPFPKVWHTFEGIRKINGEKQTFWIQDVPEEGVYYILNTMKFGFANEEPLCKFSKLTEDAESLEEAVADYQYIIGNKLSCVCMTNDTSGKPKIVGISSLIRSSVDDPLHQPKTKTYARLTNLTGYAYSVKDPFTHLGITEILADRGIYVMPEYRGQGICYEFLKCWSVIGIAVGLKAAVGTFTSFVSQGAAMRAGFSELNCFEYASLGKIDPEFCLPGIENHTKYLKLLYVTF